MSQEARLDPWLSLGPCNATVFEYCQVMPEQVDRVYEDHAERGTLLHGEGRSQTTAAREQFDMRLSGRVAARFEHEVAG